MSLIVAVYPGDFDVSGCVEELCTALVDGIRSVCGSDPGAPTVVVADPSIPISSSFSITVGKIELGALIKIFEATIDKCNARICYGHVLPWLVSRRGERYRVFAANQVSLAVKFAIECLAFVEFKNAAPLIKQAREAPSESARHECVTRLFNSLCFPTNKSRCIMQGLLLPDRYRVFLPESVKMILGQGSRANAFNEICANALRQSIGNVSVHHGRHTTCAGIVIVIVTSEMTYQDSTCFTRRSCTDNFIFVLLGLEEKRRRWFKNCKNVTSGNIKDLLFMIGTVANALNKPHTVRDMSCGIFEDPEELASLMGIFDEVCTELFAPPTFFTQQEYEELEDDSEDQEPVELEFTQ